MQTWVDNETWRAPVRLDIVIEDEPTEAATQVRAGCDFGITIFLWTLVKYNNNIIRNTQNN